LAVVNGVEGSGIEPSVNVCPKGLVAAGCTADISADFATLTELWAISILRWLQNITEGL
jgi:hypothetical protein